MRVAALVGVLGALSATAGVADAADTQLSPNATATNLSAFGGDLVYSRQIGPAEWHLVARVNGVNGDLTIAPSAQPFDADLGPGPSGGVVAVYQRCPGANTSVCPLFEIALGGGTEKRIAASVPAHCRPGQPAVAGSVIVLGLYCGSHGTRLVRVVGGRLRTLAGFPKLSRIAGTDIAGKRIAVTTDAGLAHKLAVVPVGGGSPRTVFVDNDDGGTDFNLRSPSIDGGWITFAQLAISDTGHDDQAFRLRADARNVKTNWQTDRRVFADFPPQPPPPATSKLVNVLGELDSVAVDKGKLFYALHPPDPPAGMPGVFQATDPPPSFRSGLWSR